MIRIVRGAAPPGLGAIRTAEIKRINGLPPPPTTRQQLGTRYTSVRTALWHAQDFKCCYCEMREQQHDNDVEHFRPALRATRGAGFPTHGYWWLAWTWKNLFFSCGLCNSSKSDSFSLLAGSGVLVARQQPPGGELPELIDPGRESGSRHIVFRSTDPGHVGWRPFPRNGSPRGTEMIRAAKLDRPDLLDLYKSHVRDVVRPLTDNVHSAVVVANAAAVAQAWQLVTLLFGKTREFAGLSRDAALVLVPRNVRRAWGLKVPPPL